VALDQLLHETGLLPGQATHSMIEAGPYRLSRNPLYAGLLALYLGLALLAPTFRGLVLFPAAVLARPLLDVVSRNRVSGAFDSDETDLVVTAGCMRNLDVDPSHLSELIHIWPPARWQASALVVRGGAAFAMRRAPHLDEQSRHCARIVFSQDGRARTRGLRW
jgi:Phospholipid methyltransferase